jgi:predicted permease
MGFTIVLYQVSILAIIAVIGAGAFKWKVLGNGARDALEKLVFNITTPLLILTRISDLETNPAIIRNGLFVFLFAYLIIFIQIGMGSLSARLLRLPHEKAVIHQLHTYMGNIVFLGFPLIDAVFPGGEALLYGAIYQLVSNTVMWTHGVMRLNSSKGEGFWGNLLKLINPNTGALVISIVMLLLHVKLPRILADSLGGIGSTTLYLAMIYIGILLAQSNLLKVIRRIDSIVVSMNKMLLIPSGMIFLLSWLFSAAGISADPTAFTVLIIQSAMPCMTILVIMARRFGGDDIKAMENFVVSTLLSIITLPLVIWLAQVACR